MSDVPPPIDSYNFGLQQSSSSEDELRTESALRKIVKQEIQLMMTRQELEKTVIDILRRTLGTTMEDSIRRILKEQIELEMKKFLPNVQRNGENDMPTSQPRRLSLQFRNGFSLPILTGKEIKGNGCTSIEVALIDDDLSGQVVESGPEANANLEIVVLKGNTGESDNWTTEEFNSNIVAERRGTKSLLAGNVVVKLIKGVGVVGNIKFRHSSTWMTQDEFKLGARVRDSFSGTHIREAKTESFTVKDYRNEYYKKHNTPSLTDEVWRLKNIARGRKIHEHLQEKKIDTVRDFLVLLFKDPEGLKRMVGLKSKNWEVTVEHARKCKIDKRMTCYIDAQRNKAVVFNLVDQVFGVVSGYQYIPMDMLPENDKEDARNLAVYALESRKDVLSFDDEASLLHYFSPLSASVNPTIPQGLEHPRGQNVEGSEMTVKCSYTQSNACFEDITSSINIAGGSTTHSRSLSISDYEIPQCQPSVEQGTSSAFDTESMLSDFDEYLRQESLNYNNNGQFEDLIVEAHAHQQSAATSLVMDESHPSKSWAVLIYVLRLRWVSKKNKKGTAEKLPVSKRQRVL